MEIVIKIFATGLAILVVAIVANVIVKPLGVHTWYDFLINIGDKGLLITFKTTSIPSYLFLFLIYPLILGGAGYGVAKVLS